MRHWIQQSAQPDKPTPSFRRVAASFNSGLEVLRWGYGAARGTVWCWGWRKRGPEARLLGANRGPDGLPRHGRRISGQSLRTAWRMILQASSITIPPKTARNHILGHNSLTILNLHRIAAHGSCMFLPCLSGCVPNRESAHVFSLCLLRG